MDSPDSMNPDNSCFMDLLHSQMGTQNVVAHPYDSSSQVPIFSTQCPNDAPSEVGSTQVGRRTKTTWSPADDVLLISAWLNTSKDPITSNQQKGGTFWSRIEKYFASSPKAAGRPHREAMHCKQRWGKINDIVSKFVGCYEAAEKQRSSGMNEDDVMKIALQIYFDDHKVKFTLEHAWRELRHDQKWCSSSSTRGTATTKRRKCVDGSAQSSSSQPHEEDESTTRPPGIKASKSKSKRNVNNTLTAEEQSKAWLEFQMLELKRMYDLKQCDFALREKEYALKETHSKHIMLESLLAKAEPLSETDMALKKKLIDKMFSK